MILYKLGPHKVLKRVQVGWSDQKGHHLAKVGTDREGVDGEGMDGEGIDGEKKKWRWILGMREG